MDFQSGDVLQVTWDERPIRVLMGDQIEVFYDALLPEIGWNLARARTVIYYRVASNLLGSTAQHISTEPLTPDELARHRPDLPMRMLRSSEADWDKPFAEWPNMDTGFQVEIKRLALIPFGPKGAPQKPLVVQAGNGCSFTGQELLASAHSVQADDCPEVHGVGLYRSGISRGIPSYYLWGAVDEAGHAG
jgi:hypothetical protein